MGIVCIYCEKDGEKEDMISKSVIALNVGMPNQIVQEVSEFKLNKVPYFSLLLMRFNHE